MEMGMGMGMGMGMWKSNLEILKISRETHGETPDYDDTEAT